MAHGLRGYSPSWRKIMVPGVSRCISRHKAWTEESWYFSFFSVVFSLELKPMGRCQDGSSFDLTLQMLSDLVILDTVKLIMNISHHTNQTSL